MEDNKDTTVTKGGITYSLIVVSFLLMGMLLGILCMILYGTSSQKTRVTVTTEPNTYTQVTTGVRDISNADRTLKQATDFIYRIVPNTEGLSISVWSETQELGSTVNAKSVRADTVVTDEQNTRYELSVSNTLLKFTIAGDKAITFNEANKLLSKLEISKLEDGLLDYDEVTLRGEAVNKGQTNFLILYQPKAGVFEYQQLGDNVLLQQLLDEQKRLETIPMYKSMGLLADTDYTIDNMNRLFNQISKQASETLQFFGVDNQYLEYKRTFKNDDTTYVSLTAYRDIEKCIGTVLEMAQSKPSMQINGKEYTTVHELEGQFSDNEFDLTLTTVTPLVYKDTFFLKSDSSTKYISKYFVYTSDLIKQGKTVERELNTTHGEYNLVYITGTGNTTVSRADKSWEVHLMKKTH